jgi:hypothetical protein
MALNQSKRNARWRNDTMIKSEETIHARAEVAGNTNAVAVNDSFYDMTSARKASAGKRNSTYR